MSKYFVSTINLFFIFIGAEYIVEMLEKKSKNIHRFQILRPFSRVESLPMPAATEQKGIHLVLPVMK